MQRLLKLAIFLVLSSYLILTILGYFLGDLGDPVGQYIVNKYYLIDNLKQGVFPLWNPHIFLGFPSFADPQMASFYLPDIIVWSIFPKEFAYNLSILLHLILSTFGIWKLSKFIFPKSKTTQLTVILLWILSPILLSKMVFLNLFQVFSYLPWLLYLLLKRDLKKFIFISTLCLLSGHPIAFIQIFLLLILFLFFHQKNNFKQNLKDISITSISIIGLSSFFIIPMLELQKLSIRSSLTFQDFTSGQIQLSNILQTINPFLTHQNLNDFYIYIGLVPILLTAYLFLNYKKLKPTEKSLFHASIILILSGLILSTHLGSNIVSNLLFHIPILNLIRVPARYFFFVHFGFLLISVLSIAQFSSYKKKAVILALVLNYIFVPFTFIGNYKLDQVKEQYTPAFEQLQGKSVPQTYLATSSFQFPNRHIINGYHNLIGYNPLQLESFHKTYPVSPVGSFTDPDYFLNNYSKFQLNSLQYYIFLTEEDLLQHNQADKLKIIQFLQENDWQQIDQKFKYTLWKSPWENNFISSSQTNQNLQIKNINPNNIYATLNSPKQTSTTLILNQSFYPGWNLYINNHKVSATQTPDSFTQTYQIPSRFIMSGQNQLHFKFQPISLYIGFFISTLFFILISSQFFTKINPKHAN